MKKYFPRYIDKELKELIKSSKKIIVIDGAKGCGKTEAAMRVKKSMIRIDNKPETTIALQNDPNIVLYGEKPRLIDEWQLRPWIWNLVRHDVDDGNGCYIMTGSTTPAEDKTRHSGAGRVIRFKLRPMSWYELGYSTGEISLQDVLDDKIKQTKIKTILIEEKLKYLTYGGWPFLLNESEKSKQHLMKEYIESLYTDSLLKIDGVLRDSKIGSNLLMSFARNIGTCVPMETILKDMKIHDTNISRQTLSAYYNALERIYVIEDLPAWSTHIRSTTQLRTGSKRYFVDPSLAVASLGLSIDKLKKDPNYCGFLFENEVVKNLRVYGEQIDARLFYFGENTRTTKDGVKIIENREVDIIMEFKDGSWAAFEVKYGFNDESINSGVKALNNLLKKIDFKKVSKPLSLNIITCDGFAYKRKEDGINVIPLNVLKA
ncbi:MAG: DUF4143 domain-containing protein [Mycoplasmoidaceae bacterium]|nr:MAG: DUF4143 domain-containing protein [Mycoplasmoidaceae bacterium]